MSEVKRGGPPGRAGSRSSVDWTPLLEAATDVPGEWVHMDIPEGVQIKSVPSSLGYAVYAVVAEQAVRQGVLYFRWKPGWRYEND